MIKIQRRCVFNIVMLSICTIVLISITGLLMYIVFANTKDKTASQAIIATPEPIVPKAQITSSQNIVTVSATPRISEISTIQKEEIYVTGYTTCKVNIRHEPSTESNIVSTVLFNTAIEFTEYNDKWYQIKFDDDIAYICSDFISIEPYKYTSYSISSVGFKSFMPYTAITSKRSAQYKIQHQYAYTGDYGIRQVDGRFCVALGSAIDAPMGTYIDLVLANGTIIPCILSDQKADKDTQDDNLTTADNGCVSEFLIDSGNLLHNIKVHGDVSYADESWNSPVTEIRVYAKSVFD